jgi:hypothetical protein
MSQPEESCWFIEMVHSPAVYSDRQIEQAVVLAALLDRGKLLLLEPPELIDA